jgi:hypothetical protein
LKKRKPIERPILSIYGTSTPSEFYKALSSSSGDNGFLGRMLFINGGDDVKDAKRYAKEPSESLIKAIVSFYTSTTGNMANLGNSRPYTIDCPDDIDTSWNSLEDDLRKRGDDTTRPIYRRAHANIMKLALIFSVSAGELTISHEAYAMARDIVLWSLDTIIDGLHTHVSDSDAERDSKRIEQAIKSGGDNGVTTTELFRRTRAIKKHDRDNIMTDLINAGIIIQTKRETNGRPITVWLHESFHVEM